MTKKIKIIFCITALQNYCNIILKVVMEKSHEHMHISYEILY